MKIWIMNHYASAQYLNQAGRHYWFSKYLRHEDYYPLVFSSNIYRGNQKAFNFKGKFIVKDNNKYNIPFVFVKTSKYKGNKLGRIRNMFQFFRRLFPVTKKIEKTYGKPDVILASSVHPLTLAAGIKIAKRYGVPCICEIRDLWPESIVAYTSLTRKNLLIRLLYRLEKWIYKKSDAIIMTWEGGRQYVIDQGWGKEIDLDKIYFITNGVDLEQFIYRKETYVYEDEMLDNDYYFNVVYTGAIRLVNNLEFVVDAAKKIESKHTDIRFIIFGQGTELNYLKERVENEGISNVIFKGLVERKYIPNILSRADVNLLHYSSTMLDKYGQSQNKLFEYMAAGQPILQTYSPDYSIIKKHNCGLEVEDQSQEDFIKALSTLYNDRTLCDQLSENARWAAQYYDLKNHTANLIKIINQLVKQI